MKARFAPFRCAECGDMVRLEKGPGRTEEYRRGVLLPVPADFEIPTCPTCGERYLSAERGERLARLQAPMFAEWQRALVAPLVAAIRKENGVTLRQIERACGVSDTYLSHVVAGRKEASLTLIRLLEAFAHAPSEFIRQLNGEPWSLAVVASAPSIAAGFQGAGQWQKAPPSAVAKQPSLALGGTQLNPYRTEHLSGPANDTEAA
jgi:transcriptional regulator with XRE-family HTH domain